MLNDIFIRQIKTFEAGFNCTGVIELVSTKCAICEEYKRCIYIDGSNGEYKGTAICADCAVKECAC